MNYFPTLVIGIGPTGNYVLRRIKKNLLDRGRGAPPDKVHLLWVGIEQPDLRVPGLAELDAVETIDIDPDFEAIERGFRTSPDTQKNYTWWQASPHARKYSRADGRMAFFWETQFKGNRRLSDRWNFYKNMLIRPPDPNFRVFMLASPAEAEAAMMFDLAWELREREITAWLFMPPLDPDGVDAAEASTARSAFMREMQRFTTSEQQLLDHGNQMTQLYDRALFTAAFAYDDPLAKDAVAEQLAVLMERQVGLRFNNDVRVAFSNVQDRTKLAISTSNSFTLLLPTADIHNYIGSRLAVENLFFAQADLVHPYGLAPIEKKGGINDFAGDDLDYHEAARSFLREDLKEGETTLPAYPFSMISFAAERQWPNRIAQLPTNLESAFHDRLQVFLNQQMNRVAVRRESTGALLWAEGFLNQLKGLLEDAHYTLRQHSSNDPGGRMLFRSFESLQEIIGQYQDQVTGWKTAVLKTLYPEMQNRLRAAQDTLKKTLSHNPTRRAVLPNFPGIEADPGAYYYRELMPLPQGKQTIDLSRGLLAWKWEQDARGQAILSICVTSPGVEEQGSKKQYFNAVELGASPTKFAGQWVDDHISLTRFVVDQISLMTQMKDNEVKFSENDFHPLLKHDPIPFVGRRSLLYIVGKDMQYLRKWASEGGLDISGEGIIESEYGDCVTIIQIDLNLDAQSSHLYAADKDTNRSRPEDFVFPGEQAAARVEGEIRGLKTGTLVGRRTKAAATISAENLPERPAFAPEFVRLMADPQAFETVMKLVFLDWIKPQTDDFGRAQWVIQAPQARVKPIILSDEMPGFTDNNLAGAVRTILITYPYRSENTAHPLHGANFNNTLARLKQVVDAAMEDSTRLKKEMTALVERVKNWEDDKSPIFQGLVLYQKYLYLKIKEDASWR